MAAHIQMGPGIHVGPEIMEIMLKSLGSIKVIFKCQQLRHETKAILITGVSFRRAY